MAARLLVKRIQESLSLDLLLPQWRRQVKLGDSPFKGHCYIASEALYYLWGRDNGYRPHHVWVGDCSHWFLRHPSGSLLDPTREQFSFEVDYSSSRGCGFLTKIPSKRCAELLRRIRCV